MPQAGTPGEASTSSTTNGIPSAARWTRATTSSSAVDTHARTICATVPASKRPSRTCRELRLPTSRWITAPASDETSVTTGGHTQDACSSKVVAEVLDNGQGVRIRPVQNPPRP